jgi:hypothetical protein
VPVSVVTDRLTWYKAFKDYQGCPDVSDSLLWWIPDTFLDEKANFDDYAPIGGWKLPFAKLYTQKVTCGGAVYQSYYPD